MNNRFVFIFSLLILLINSAVCFSQPSSVYPWLAEYDSINSLHARIKVPDGFNRIDIRESSFGYWLRNLPLKPGKPAVRLYNGSLKTNQETHIAVINIDTGHKNLQQCADAIIRLRAEYLWYKGFYEQIHFNFLSGFNASYLRWRDGFRPVLEDNKITEIKSAQGDNSYQNFREYLETVFNYANTWSLSQEMQQVVSADSIQIGDLFICGKRDGICHAVIVVDMAINQNGEKSMLLAQSFMPAQDIHILKNPNSDNPWYNTQFDEKLVTPEWTFYKYQIKRFK